MEKNLSNFFYKLLLMSILIGASYLLIYNILLFKIVSSLLRFLIISIVIIIMTIFIFLIIKRNLSFSKGIVIMSYSLILLIGSSFSNSIFNKIGKMSISYNIKSMNIIKLKTRDLLGDITIGTISSDFDELKKFKYSSNIDGKIIIKDSYTELVNALYDEEISLIYIPSNYLESISSIDGFENIINETEIVYTNLEKEAINNPDIDINKNAFSILVMGVDSSEDSMINSSFNGDALILITFNPNNLKATILSIPRDTYTNITCFDGERKNKITHAAWYGESCMIDTINELFDINIDYFVKINFKGFVSIIDLLGGIDVDVPITFCEQDSNRNFENQICLDEGYRHLNGEEALALARHRKTINDFIRGDNQKLIIEAVLEKIKTINKVDILYSIFDTISNNVVTNISSDDILSLYNIVKKKNMIEIYKLKLEGYGEYIYDYSELNNQGMKMELYNFVPYIESIENLKSIMKQNINGEELVLDGSNNYSSNLILLPNFIGRTVEEAQSFCSKYNIELSINEVISNNTNDYEGKIIGQDKVSSMDVDYVKTLTIDVVSKIEEVKNEIINCSKEEFKNESDCLIPNFINQDYSVFKEWLKKNNYSFRVVEEKITKNDIEYDASKKELIVSQNILNGSIFDIIGKTFKIRYIEN